MRSRFAFALVFLILTFASQLGGQNLPPRRQEFAAILFPVFMQVGAPGGNDSVWKTEIHVIDVGPEPVRFASGDDCHLVQSQPCFGPFPTIIPSVDASLIRTNAPTPPNPGALYYIDIARVGDVALSLRVADVSHRDLATGTELPVVREHDFRSTTTQLLGVPLRAGWRSSLRAYSLDTENGEQAVLRIYDSYTGGEVYSTALPLLRQLPLRPFTIEAAYAELSLNDLFLPTHTRAEVDPPTGRHIWAFISSASNATNEVVLSTPANE